MYITFCDKVTLYLKKTAIQVKDMVKDALVGKRCVTCHKRL